MASQDTRAAYLPNVLEPRGAMERRDSPWMKLVEKDDAS